VSAPSYAEFLSRKAAPCPQLGFEVANDEIHPLLKPHQRAMVRWAVLGGRRAIFAAFGLGKSVMQLEALRLTLVKAGGGRGLIVAPLGVRQEFRRDAAMLGIPLTFIRSIEEAGPEGLYITNYETVRDGKLDPRHFTAASLDEASVLRGFGGTKTFREFMKLFAGDDRSGVRTAGVPYRFVATATPSPNEYIELLAYAAYLDVMDVSQAKTRFFKRDSTQADKLTLHGHKEREFWLWVSSWALFVQKPSDLGFSDEGYDLPPIDVRWHEVSSDHAAAGWTHERDGQAKLFRNAAGGVVEAAREKRDSLPARLAKLMELRAEVAAAHRILWHDLEDERRALEASIPDAVCVYGSQDLDEREQAIIDFSEGRIREIGGKPVMLGSGCNLQHHCAWAIYLGIGFKFNDFIQSVHRLHRFLQSRPVRVDLIYTEAERDVRKSLEGKWRRHEEMVARMSEIIREYGLGAAAMDKALGRSIGVERRESAGEGFHLVNADSVEETARMATDSVHLIVTSIPFSTQYEYTPSYNDFGHTDSNEHFWSQMDYLTPELLRVLQPGRVCCVHVKDRIVPGGLTGLGFQTLYPFHADAIRHFTAHGFAFLGMVTVLTDVVRENNQTYRLGWSEQCKDGTRMGFGVPEYVLKFRKPPSDSSSGYADVPVVKSKEEYTRARWQLDAHALWRSSGDRLVSAAELLGMPAKQVYRTWRAFNVATPYDHENHVRAAEELDARGALPSTFMLLPPASWADEVWGDVARMLTLNTAASAKGREMHLCPLQFDIG
jgi:hypothetical protein